MDLIVNPLLARSPGESEVEMVERKGLGHPDSICDAVAEAFSLALCRSYLEFDGRVHHHNVDKVMLAAGSSEPAFGGGRVIEPMRMILAGRAATVALDGEPLPIEGIANEVVRGWLGKNIHALDAERHVDVSCVVRPGSRELVDLFEGGRQTGPMANDSSFGVGFAPLSELERMVLAIEMRLNSQETREHDPALGEDVKVMAFRHDDAIRVVVACAMVDDALRGIGDYRAARDRAAQIALEAARKVSRLPTEIGVNVGDDLAAGQIYLTVTGTSAEAGDDGQTGRGNRVNGLITPHRPMTMESVAGKNPITHVGKLYNIAAGIIAQQIVDALPDAEGAECRMVSTIGCPIDDPQIVEVRLYGTDADECAGMATAVEAIVRQELGEISGYSDRLLSGEMGIDRWPLLSSRETFGAGTEEEIYRRGPKDGRDEL
jgi:S-adenosylmethionine synthetase